MSEKRTEQNGFNIVATSSIPFVQMILRTRVNQKIAGSLIFGDDDAEMLLLVPPGSYSIELRSVDGSHKVYRALDGIDIYGSTILSVQIIDFHTVKFSNELSSYLCVLNAVIDQIDEQNSDLNLSAVPFPAIRLALSELSEPGSNKSWSRPSKVRADVVETGKGLKVFFVEERDSLRISRLRLTILVEGRQPFRVHLPLFTGGAVATLEPADVDIGSSDVSVVVTPLDEKPRVLLNALESLPRSEAADIARKYWDDKPSPAVFALAHTGVNFLPAFLHRSFRRDDLYADVIAALILVRTRNCRVYNLWLILLAHNCPHIPDAHIAAAWGAAAKGADDSEREALDYLITARKIGTPVFLIAQKFATQLLLALRDTAEDEAVRNKAGSELHHWFEHSRRRNYKGALVIWEPASGTPSDGNFPPQQYQIIADNPSFVPGMIPTPV